ncbi:MAG: TetR family transcriptional regulator [Streptomycetaceae bacterium]|nr:TetR family transcriptional regulator [Streptomycetaceae bacterium]
MSPRGQTGDKAAGAGRGGAPTRRSYHHGDLRNALVEAATQLVRAGGPEALVLREVARETGVSSTAAYRHFESHKDLVEAVKEQAGQVMVQRVRDELAASSPSDDPVAEALRRIDASGRGYVRFALTEPGLFRLMFRERAQAGGTAARLAVRPKTPAEDRDASYMVMADALDALVDLGALSAERRPFADISLWAGVHGLSVLLIDSQLAALPEDIRQAVIDRTFDVLVHGVYSDPKLAPG